MTTRFTWISSAATPSLRKATFGPSDGLEEKARDQALALAGSLPKADRIRHAPDRAARETAAALGLITQGDSLSVAPGLAEIDFGVWRGKSLLDIQADGPEDLMHWVSDPAAAPHGGESIVDFCHRIGQWMQREAEEPGWVQVVGPANGLRAAVLHCLQAGPTSFRRVDVMPLTTARFSHHEGQWRLQALNTPPG